MTFYEHYGMAFNPFHKSNVASENCFRSRDFMNMEKRIEALAETGGLGVFSAKSGMGKTFTARFCARTLDPAVYVTKYFDQPGASRMQFMKKVARLLGLDDTGGSTKLFDRIQESLMRFHSEQKKMLILVIDDAQDLQESVLLFPFVYFAPLTKNNPEMYSVPDVNFSEGEKKIYFAISQSLGYSLLSKLYAVPPK